MNFHPPVPARSLLASIVASFAHRKQLGYSLPVGTVAGRPSEQLLPCGQKEVEDRSVAGQMCPTLARLD